MAGQPAGTVTLVFTDIEGSTRLLHGLGQERYRNALGEHRQIVREAFARHKGYEVDYEGDAFFYAFASAPEAVAAVAEAQAGLDSGPIRIRVGIHTGSPGLDPPKYVGVDVHLAARIMSAGHGGQVLLSGAVRDALGPSNSLLLGELGEHRLKDFDSPVALFQLGKVRFPPLKTISNTNLPRPASSFVGREREMAAITELVRESRLVTLTGPGGTGKTRLAIEVAAELVGEYKAGVFWVGLADLRDPAFVLDIIAQAVGAKGDLVPTIGEREMLLLLDNLEQVIDCARDLSGLVQACENLHLLVTSRELLRIGGEIEFPVPPLAQSEAVELFCVRARAEPSKEVAELCRRLDEMPLAVELAAARAAHLTTAQILERLPQRLDLFKGGREADPRQQTLRGTIDWSHDLLGEQEKRLFARFSVFAGCALDAAEEVCDADLDTIGSLLDKSLLRRTGERYWMLETIREYAAEQLDALGEAGELGRRRDNYFLALAEEAGAELQTSRQLDWFARLDEEYGNLRATVLSALATGRLDVVCRIAAAIWRYWETRDQIAEAVRLIEPVVAAEVEVSTELRAGALFAAGSMNGREGRFDVAAARLEEAAELFRVLDDPIGSAFALAGLSRVRAFEENRAEALTLARTALDIAKGAGDIPAQADALVSLSIALVDVDYGGGDLEGARAATEEGLAFYRQMGDVGGIAASLGNLGLLAQQAGDYDLAASLMLEALGLAQERGDLWLTTVDLMNLAWLSLVRGSWEEARSYALRSLELCEATGYLALPAHPLRAAAGALAAEQRDGDAARMAGAWKAAPNAVDPGADDPVQPLLEQARARVGEREWAAAEAEGTRMGLRGAIELLSGVSARA